MTVLKGLAGLKKFQEEANKPRYEKVENPTNWMRLKGGMWIKGRFLQELDEESPNFSADFGAAKIVLEHTGPGPKGYQRRAECTIHEGHCYVDERRAKANAEGTEDWRNWGKAKPRIYVNFLVTEAGGTGKDDKGKTVENPHTAGEVIVVGQSVDSDQSIVKSLLEYASDGTITDRQFKISCDGEGTKTTYTLRGFDKEEFKETVEPSALNDLSLAYRQVPYEEQARFYGSAPGWVDTFAGGQPQDAEKTEEKSSGPKQPGFANW